MAEAGKGLKAGSLGLFGNLTMGISSVAPAYSLAAAMAGLVAVAGAKVPAMFVVGFIPMLLTAFAFRELAADVPDCGSTFTWVTRAFGPWVGWVSGWASVVAAVIAVGNGGQIAAIYLFDAMGRKDWGGSTVAQLTVGSLVVLALLVLSLRGIDITRRAQALMVGLQIGVLLVVSVVALVKVLGHHAGPQAVAPQWDWLSPAGLSSGQVARAGILCVFAYWGWDACLSVSEETKNPHRTPGRAAVLATVATLGTYVLVGYAVEAFAGFGVTGIGLNNPVNANDTLSVLGDPVVGGGLAVVLLLGISASSAASTLTCLVPTARNMLSMAVYGALPARFGRVHPRLGTPWFGTAVVGLAGVGCYVVMMLVSQDSLADMVSSLGLATAFRYAMTAYACVWTYRRTLRGSVRDLFLRGIFPLAGAVAMTWAFVESAVQEYAPGYGKTHLGPVGSVFLLGIGLLVLGVPVAALCRTTRRDFFRGITLNARTDIVVADSGAITHT